MKQTKKLCCMFMSLLLIIGVLIPTVAGSQDGEEITEMFGYDLFSDETVNSFLSVIPEFCCMFEQVAEDTFRQIEFTIPEAINSVDNVSCSGAKVYFNGQEGTGLIRDIFAPMGMNIYPDTLATFIANQGNNGLNSIIYSLRNRGKNWTQADLSDGFNFDWGIDALTDPAARYERFAYILGMLIEGTRIFKIMLQGSYYGTGFPGDIDFLHILVENVEYKMSIVNYTIGSLIFSDISGEIMISGGDLYSGYILPIYRALGLGTALPYTFVETTNCSMSGYQIVRAIYDPFMYLADTVRSAPGACRSLVDFYSSDACRSFVNQIPDGNTVPLNIRFKIVDGKLEGYEGPTLGESSLSSILGLISDRLIALINDCLIETTVYFCPFGEDGNMEEYLAESLPALKYTEPEQPTEETSEPTEETSAPTEETSEPTEETSAPTEETSAPTEETSAPTEETSKPIGEEPTEPAAGDENGQSGQEESVWQRFISRITSIFRIISEWFRKLFGGR